MTTLKLTKSELRVQQVKLTQLQRYLPTLQLKKAMLQSEVGEVRLEVQSLEREYSEARLLISHESSVLTEQFGLDLSGATKVEKINKHYENIAGVDIPIFDGLTFAPFDYDLFSTPAWLDVAIDEMRKLAVAKAKIVIAEEKKRALEKELREVTIRVNLFEKNLIPKAISNIRKIKVFLGDMALAAVSQAKVAKRKIEERKLSRNKEP